MLDSDLITYSLKEASIILKVTPRSVWNYIQKGKLEGGKVGGQWKVSEVSLKKFIKQNFNKKG